MSKDEATMFYDGVANNDKFVVEAKHGTVVGSEETTTSNHYTVTSTLFQETSVADNGTTEGVGEAILGKVGDEVLTTEGTTESTQSWSSSSLLSQKTATLVNVNYLPVSYILLPAAFARGGCILGTVLVSLVVLQTYVTAMFVLETCARAEVTHKYSLLVSTTSLRKECPTKDQKQCQECENGGGDEERNGQVHEPKVDNNRENNLDENCNNENNNEMNHDSNVDNEDNTNIIDSKNTQKIHKVDFQASEPTFNVNQRQIIPLIIGENKYELSVLCTMFLSDYWCYFFTACMAFEMYGINIVFCTVFGQTLSGQFPNTFSSDGAYDYELYVVLFLVLAIPLSCTSILDQLPVQLSFLFMRTVVIWLMILTLVGAFVSGNNAFGTLIEDNTSKATALVNSSITSSPDSLLEEDNGNIGTTYRTSSNGNAMVELANFSQTINTIQVTVFTTAFQCFVPIIASMTKNKTKVRSIITHSVLYNYIINTILGLLMLFYFGSDNVQDSSNLNWLSYQGILGRANDNDNPERSPVATILCYLIVLFAAIDGLAIYPLVSVCMSDILMGAVYGSRVHIVEKNWKIKGSFRLLGSLPSAIIAFFVRDLGIVAVYSGVATLLCYTLCPAMLFIASGRYMSKHHMGNIYLVKKYNQHSRIFSHNVVAYGLIVIVVVVVSGVIIESIV